MKHYKSSSKIKEQMEFWYYKSHRIGVDMQSIFILFQLLGEEYQNVINSMVKLKQGELIVYVLYQNNEEYILNTTERFVKITNQNVEEISYVDFRYISLDKLTLIQTKKLKRIDTEYTDCFIFSRKGEITIWSIPTKIVNSFIQNTKRCELIGRKYL